jgi:flagellin FlaB
MFENESEENERGQVGIGTLIVFIAMVLVAAIAAGVLVNTAGFLQSTAEESGEESVEKVTNRVEVVSSYGEVGNADTGISDMYLTVRLAAGSDNVNMNDTTINYLSETKATTIEYDSTGAGNAAFGLSPQRDTDDSSPVFNDRGDRFQIHIDANAVEGGSDLSAGDEVKLEISTKTGDTSIVVVTIPDTFSGKSTGDPIAL